MGYKVYINRAQDVFLKNKDLISNLRIVPLDKEHPQPIRSYKKNDFLFETFLHFAKQNHYLKKRKHLSVLSVLSEAGMNNTAHCSVHCLRSFPAHPHKAQEP